jgi:hypothetical protein
VWKLIGTYVGSIAPEQLMTEEVKDTKPLVTQTNSITEKIRNLNDQLDPVTESYQSYDTSQLSKPMVKNTVAAQVTQIEIKA